MGRGPEIPKDKVLHTEKVVEGDVAKKRAIFRKIIKHFKKPSFNKAGKINDETFIDSLRYALNDDYFPGWDSSENVFNTLFRQMNMIDSDGSKQGKLKKASNYYELSPNSWETLMHNVSY